MDPRRPLGGNVADQVLGPHTADTLLSLGGGSATGLGKALRLRHDVHFVAVPTTWSGSQSPISREIPEPQSPPWAP